MSFESTPTPAEIAVNLERFANAFVFDPTDVESAEIIAAGKMVYEAASQSAVQAVAPTLAGRAARAIAVQYEFSEPPGDEAEVMVWLSNSLRLLNAVPSQSRRLGRRQVELARAETLFDYGRILHHQFRTNRAQTTTQQARDRFRHAESKLRKLHRLGEHWPVQGAESAYHWAVFEGDEGTSRTNSAHAGVLALRGMWRALRLEPNDKNSRDEHREFVHENFRLNRLAGLVAVTQLVRAVPGVRSWRQKTRDELLG